MTFPAQVVLTANPKEEQEGSYAMPSWHGDNWHSPAANLMFVRLRTSATNLRLVDQAVAAWTDAKVPCVITFMAYYDREPAMPEDLIFKSQCYEWRVRHINSYWCPTKDFMRWVMSRYQDKRLVSMCSSIESSYCRNCRNCETHYLQTMKEAARRMNAIVTITVAGLVAGTLLIIAPPAAAIVVVLGIGAICVFGYLALQKEA